MSRSDGKLVKKQPKMQKSSISQSVKHKKPSNPTLSSNKSISSSSNVNSDIQDQSNSNSDSDQEASEEEEDDRASDLAQLQKFGSDFLESFTLPTATKKSNSKLEKIENKKNKKRKLVDEVEIASKNQKGKSKQSQQEMELDQLLAQTEKDAQRIQDESDSESEELDSEGPSDDENGFHEGISDEEQGKNIFTPPSRSSAVNSQRTSDQTKRIRKVPETVVFDGQASSRGERNEDGMGREKWKSFMSSKISNLSKDESSSSTNNKPKTTISESEANEEKQLASNDKELSRLLSTTLFAPGSTNSSTSKNGKSNLSSNDTLARLMELTSTSSERKGQSIGRGWGENALKRKSQGSMPDSIRTGLRKKAALIEEKEIDKAKELGIWHPSLKKNFGGNSVVGKEEKGEMNSRRQRGIGSGFGTFKNGALRVGEDEIKRINNSGRGGRGGKRGRGGGRGGSKR